MSKIYVVLEADYAETDIVNAWATEEEAIAYCNEHYSCTNSGRSWISKNWGSKFCVYIEEVDFVSKS